MDEIIEDHYPIKDNPNASKHLSEWNDKCFLSAIELIELMGISDYDPGLDP